MRKSPLVLSFALIATLAIAGCRASVPIDEPVKASYGTNAYAESAKLTLSDYEKAIVRAGTYRRWVAKQIAPGQLEFTNTIRDKHTVVLDIVFDTETFSIKRKSTTNLRWNPTTKTIHPNYNFWIDLLEADIKAEIQRLRAS